MKRIIFLLALGVFYQCSENSEPVPSPPTPTLENTEAVVVATPNKSTLRNIHFINSKVGFIAGGTAAAVKDEQSASILKTTDGGQTWSAIYSKVEGFYCTAITSLSESTLMATTNQNFILKTEDGGNSWKKVEVAASSFYMADIHFSDVTTGYIAGSIGSTGVLLQSTDGGATWNTLVDNSQPESILKNNVLNKITSLDNGATLLVVGGTFQEGVVLRSENAGATWELLAVAPGIVLKDIKLSETTGYAVGHNGQVSSTEKGAMYATADKGKTWTLVDTGFDNKLNSLAQLGNNIVVVGDNHNNDFVHPELILLSTDAGTTWARVPHELVVAGWESVAFIEDNHLLAVGYNGNALHVEIKNP